MTSKVVQGSCVVWYTLIVQLSSQRTSLKFFPRLELLLRKHTLMIFTGKMLSLGTCVVGENSEESDWLVGDMLLQDRVLVSPDIICSQPKHTTTHTACMLLFLGMDCCYTLLHHFRPPCSLS